MSCFGWIKAGWFLPVVWVMLVAFSVYLVMHLVLIRSTNSVVVKRGELLRNPYLYLMAGIFLLAMDFWNWGKVQPAFWGIPALQTLAMYRLVKS